MRKEWRQVLIGFGAILVPTLLLYLVVAFRAPATARFIGFGPSFCDELSDIVTRAPSAGLRDDRWMQLAAARDRYCRE